MNLLKDHIYQWLSIVGVAGVFSASKWIDEKLRSFGIINDISNSKYGITVLLLALILFTTISLYLVIKLHLSKDRHGTEEKSKIAQEISSLVKTTNDSYDDVLSFWNRNFSHADFERSIESFEKYPMYDDTKTIISTLAEKMVELESLHNKNIVLFEEDLTDLIQRYLDGNKISYLDDGIGMINTSNESYFKNLKENAQERRSLAKKILNKTRAIVRR